MKVPKKHRRTKALIGVENLLIENLDKVNEYTTLLLKADKSEEDNKRLEDLDLELRDVMIAHRILKYDNLGLPRH